MKPETSISTRRLAALTLAALIAGCGGESAPSLIASGKTYLAKNDARAAVIQFKSALQRDPKSAEGRYLLGQALLANNDPAGAAVELAKAADQRWDDSRVMPALAKAMLLSGGARKLTSLYGELALADPTANAAFKCTLASAWNTLGEKARMQAAMQAAFASVPGYAPALVLQARQTAGEGRLDEALAAVERALAADAAIAEGWQLQGEILGIRNDAAGAEAAFRRALAAEPAFVPAHLALVTQALKAEDIAKAKVQAGRLRAVLPKHPQTLYVDARLALYDKDLKTARELTQQLVRFAPDNTGVLQLAGQVEAQVGSPVIAESYFTKALQLDAGLAPARRSLVKLYLRLGQPAKALRTVDKLAGPESTDSEAIALAGEAQLQLGDPRAAEKLFLQAARFAPGDSRLRTALAVLRLERGDAESAFAQLESIAADSRDSAADLAIVSARLKRSEYDAALRALDTMAVKQPRSATVAELRGRVHVARNDTVAARAAFEHALVLEPARFSATAALAQLDVREGKRVQARARLEAAIAADPRNHAARMALAELRADDGVALAEVRRIIDDGIKAAPAEAGPRLQLIELLLRKKQYKDALSVAQEAAAARPDDVEIQDALGRTQELAGDTQQAISTYRRLASLDTRQARPHLRLADLQKAEGNREGAIASLRRALEIDPTLDAAQARLVDLLISDGRPKDALEMAQRLEQRSPASPLGWLLEGAIHRRVKAPDAAIQAYRNGIRQASDASAIAIELHRTLLQAGRRPEAERFGAERQKSHPEDLAFEYHLATAAVLRNDLEDAEQRLQHVLVRQPNHAMALNNLAWVLVQRGRPGAVPYAQKAVELLPNRPALMDTLAIALAAERQAPKALELQKRAVEMAPGEFGMRLNLARIAAQAGDKALARSELDRLAAMGDTLPFHAEVTRMLGTL